MPRAARRPWRDGGHRVAGRGYAASSACCWRRPSLRLRSFGNRPMEKQPSALSSGGRRSSFQRHQGYWKGGNFLRSQARLAFRWPRRRHLINQRPRLRSHRNRLRRQRRQCPPNWRSYSRRWRAISQTWSKGSSSSRRATNNWSKWSATMLRPLSGSGQARKKWHAFSPRLPRRHQRICDPSHCCLRRGRLPPRRVNRYRCIRRHRPARLQNLGLRPSLINWPPEFTNEVQHFQQEVLPWGGLRLTSTYPLKTDARLPDFQPMATRSGKSRQLWIVRHQRSLGS